MNNYYVTDYTRAGLSHVADTKNIRPCEDMVADCMDKSGNVCVIALSDGCGTASFAGKGAELAVRAGAEFSAENFDRLYAMTPSEREEAILFEIRKILFRNAMKLDADISDFSCTLLISALRNDGKGFYFHIGDGLIFARTSDGGIRLMSHYNHKYSNITSFVTSLKTNCITGVTDNVTAFFMTSDGAEPFLLRNYKSAGLFIQLAHILPKNRMYSEFNTYTERIMRKGIYDDVSYITLSMNRDTPAVFRQMFCGNDRKLKNAMFGNIRPQTVEKYAVLIDMLAVSDNGISIKKVTKLMRTHRTPNTLRRLQPLVSQGIIIVRNSRCFINR